jgi:hypothetical protein
MLHVLFVYRHAQYICFILKEFDSTCVPVESLYLCVYLRYDVPESEYACIHVYAC